MRYLPAELRVTNVYSIERSDRHSEDACSRPGCYPPYSCSAIPDVLNASRCNTCRHGREHSGEQPPYDDRRKRRGETSHKAHGCIESGGACVEDPAAKYLGDGREDQTAYRLTEHVQCRCAEDRKLMGDAELVADLFCNVGARIADNCCHELQQADDDRVVKLSR